MTRFLLLLLLAAASLVTPGRSEAAGSCSGNWTTAVFSIGCSSRESSYAYSHDAGNQARLCPAGRTRTGVTYTEGPTGGFYYYTAHTKCTRTSDGNISTISGQTSSPIGLLCENAAHTWDPVAGTCLADCVAGTGSSGTFRMTATPPTCNPDSCTVAWTKDGVPYVIVDSTGTPATYQRWIGTTTGGAHCSVAPDADGDGTPDATDSFPSDPTEKADTDGDGIADNADPMPNDPTNGEDTGPGDETDNVSNGGGNCATPPSSTGDAIAANIAYQTWATRCAIEKLNAAMTGNGTGTTPGGGSGTDMTATNAKLDGIKTGTDNLAGESDLDEGSASGTIADIWSNETETPDFDMGGLGLSRSCPSPPTITLAGMSRTIDTDALCSLSEVVAALVLVMTAAHAAYIFAGRSA